MSYVLKQFNQRNLSPTPVESDTTYMTLLSNGTPKRRKHALDSGVEGEALDPFFDECIQLSSYLKHVSFF